MNTEAEKIIKIKYASKDHQFCVGACLAPNQGVTHGVFNLVQPDNFEEKTETVEVDGVAEERVIKTDILDTFKHIHVPQVVREKKMHYQRVPRLGSYLAIPMTYRHCLTDSALDEATNDYKNVMAQREEQEREKEKQKAIEMAKRRAAEIAAFNEKLRLEEEKRKQDALNAAERPIRKAEEDRVAEIKRKTKPHFQT